MHRHSLLFKHSETAALIFARKVPLQQYCAEPVTVHSAISREWGWAGLSLRLNLHILLHGSG